MSFPSRYPGRCARCAGAIATGALIEYDHATKKATHARCGAPWDTGAGPAPALEIESANRGAPRTDVISDAQIRTIVERLDMSEDERALLLRRALTPRPASRSAAADGTSRTVTVHTICCRCGGSGADGRPMAHLECVDDAEKDLPF